MRHLFVSILARAKYILPLAILGLIGAFLLWAPVAPNDCKQTGRCAGYTDPDAPVPGQPDEAAAFRRQQLENEFGEIPVDAWTKAASQIELMRAAQRTPEGGGLGTDQWKWLGPGNVGGRIRSLIIHPTSPEKMWVGSVSGGIWATTDGGAKWKPVDDFMANLAVSTMVLNPTNPSHMYAGTGENGFSPSNDQLHRGAGVFQSTDGGVTWSQMPGTDNEFWYNVNRLAISPNGQRMLAVTYGQFPVTGVPSYALWISTAPFNSWIPVLIEGSDGNLGEIPNFQMKDVDFSPTSSDKAVMSGSFGKAFYSSDGGVNWTQATGLPALPWGGRVELVFSRAETNVVYASVNKITNAQTRAGGELWKSSDNGASYTRLNTGDEILGTQGWYDNILWADPTDADIIIVGGVDLFRSDDGGVTFTRISSNERAYQDRSTPHPDQHMIVEHPDFDGTLNKTVFFTNDGGVFKTDDVYTATIDAKPYGWQEINNNLGITQYFGAAGNATTGVIVGGTQDNGSLRYTPTGGTEGHTTTSWGDGGFVAADRGDSTHFYGEYVYLTIYRSTNSGVSASNIYQGDNGTGKLTDAGSQPGGAPARANFIAPFILDWNNSNRMLAGGMSLWRSDNVKAAKPTWTAIKDPIGTTCYYHCISAIAVQRGDAERIWVGYNNGEIWRTDNGTTANPTWTKLSKPWAARMVTRIVPSWFDADTAYVTLGGFAPDNVWRTANSGGAWTNVTGSGATGLPDVPVRTLAQHPYNRRWLYVGTEVGIFATQDSGQTWSVSNEGPANISVDELSWMSYDLLAATYGRGLFKIQLGVRANKVSTTDQALTPKSVFNPGDPIQWVAEVENLLDAQPAAELTFVTRDPNGVESTVHTGTTGPLTQGVTTLPIAGTIPLVGPAGTWTVTLKVNWVGNTVSDITTQVATYEVNPGPPTMPPNDDFDSPIEVTTPYYGNMQDTVGATTAIDDPSFMCGDFFNGQGGNSVWYQYTAPANGMLSADTIDSPDDFDTVIAIWTGARGSLVLAGCNDDYAGAGYNSAVQVPVIAGTTYYIESLSYNPSTGGDLTFVMIFAPDMSMPPANDEVAMPLLIDPTPYSNVQETIAATTALSDPILTCGSLDQGHYSVWYSFMAPSDGALSIDTLGSSYNTQLAIWTGLEGSLLSVDCNDDAPTGGVKQSKLDLSVLSGIVYHVEVTGHDLYSYGELHVNASFAPAISGEPNDTFGNAIVISSSIRFPSTSFFETQDTTAATTAVDDPILPCSSYAGQGVRTVWYRFTAPEDGTMTVDTLNSEFNTVLAVWTGAQGSLQSEACNDDISFGDNRSQVELPVTAGMTYHIEVAGATPTAFGEMGLNMVFAPVPDPPSNDNFANALTVGSTPYSNTQMNTKATTENDDPSFSCDYPFEGQGTYSTWYRYTASENGLLKVNTLNSNHNTVLAVWTGQRGSLEMEGCNDDFEPLIQQSSAEIPVMAGKVYYIEVVGYDNDTYGEMKIEMDFIIDDSGFSVYLPSIVK